MIFREFSKALQEFQRFSEDLDQVFSILRIVLHEKSRFWIWNEILPDIWYALDPLITHTHTYQSLFNVTKYGKNRNIEKKNTEHSDNRGKCNRKRARAITLIIVCSTSFHKHWTVSLYYSDNDFVWKLNNTYFIHLWNGECDFDNCVLIFGSIIEVYHFARQFYFRYVNKEKNCDLTKVIKSTLQNQMCAVRVKWMVWCCIHCWAVGICRRQKEQR